MLPAISFSKSSTNCLLSNCKGRSIRVKERLLLSSPKTRSLAFMESSTESTSGRTTWTMFRSGSPNKVATKMRAFAVIFVETLFHLFSGLICVAMPSKRRWRTELPTRSLTCCNRLQLSMPIRQSHRSLRTILWSVLSSETMMESTAWSPTPIGRTTSTLRLSFKAFSSTKSGQKIPMSTSISMNSTTRAFLGLFSMITTFLSGTLIFIRRRCRSELNLCLKTFQVCTQVLDRNVLKLLQGHSTSSSICHLALFGHLTFSFPLEELLPPFPLATPSTSNNPNGPSKKYE